MLPPEELNLLLAVSDGLYIILKERLDKQGTQYDEVATLGPFRKMIEATTRRRTKKIFVVDLRQTLNMPTMMQHFSAN